MTNREAQQLVGKLVRIDPRFSNCGPHWGRGKLLSVSGDEAIVLPLGGHNQNERIPLRYLKNWKAKNADTDAQ